MTMTAGCPQCGTALLIREEHRGVPVRCPRCGQPFVTPGEATPAVPLALPVTAPVPTPPPPSAVAPADVPPALSGPTDSTRARVEAPNPFHDLAGEAASIPPLAPGWRSVSRGLRCL